MTHAFITVCLPVSKDREDQTQSVLEDMGHPLRPDLAEKVKDLGTIHFLSLTLIPYAVDAQSAYLMLEASADGDPDSQLAALCRALEPEFCNLLRVAGLPSAPETVRKTLEKGRLRIGLNLWDQPGLTFTGTPDYSVRRILDEADLARAVAPLVEVRKSPSALETLDAVRDSLRAGPCGKLLTPAPVPFLDNPRILKFGPALSLAARTLFLPVTLLSLAALILGTLIGMNNGSQKATIPASRFPEVSDIVSLFSQSLMGSLEGAGITAILLTMIWVALAGLTYAALRKAEQTDPAEDSPPPLDRLAAITARENCSPPELDTPVLQNHLAGVSVMKPGLLRAFTLRFAYLVIATLATFQFRPGFLGDLGTIHFARWVKLPRTNILLFFSNYGGSWESYLEDFITKASHGLTGVWSNTKHYPRTENLFFKGATDGDRFKRWARNQQYPTWAWYSAYPHLTTARIRTNAAIRRGLALARTESEARDWLSLFGSAPSDPTSLEAADIQTLAFGGLGHMPFGCIHILGLSDTPSRNKALLQCLLPKITSAASKPRGEALVLALSATGLKKLGLNAEESAQFPIAFTQGMAHPTRARILGDVGVNAPENWVWGQDTAQADAALLLYAETAEGLNDLKASLKPDLDRFDARILSHIPLQPLVDVNGQPTRQVREPFGFVDGISNPILKGTPRALKAPNETDHLLNPGEFILGYPDSRGYIPPSPVTEAERDPAHILPAAAPKDLARLAFAPPLETCPRDLGRNSSFLVIRQLQQHTDRFQAYLREAAQDLAPLEAQGLISKDPREPLTDWIGAKMIGRWPDGSSMTRHAYVSQSRDKPNALPDNRFRYGEDDRDGYGCPFGAHIRRANPRDSLSPDTPDQLAITNRHRLLRVGRTYSLTPHDKPPEVGLAFMCLNADLERQFEFVQQTWSLAPQFHGLDDEIDPIFGRGNAASRLTIPTPNGPIRLRGMPDFVTVRGGGYFLMPGLRLLHWLSR
ncbi:MAG: Dyp-type peroxidase [Asticcacaulis sp.]